MQSRSNGSQPAKADQVSDSMILAIWAYERAMVLFWSLKVLHVLVPAYHAQGCMEQKHRLCPRRKQTNDPKSDFRMCSQTRARGDMALRPTHRIDWPKNIGGDRANPVRFTQLVENVCAEATHKTYETRTRALHQACRAEWETQATHRTAGN